MNTPHPLPAPLPLLVALPGAEHLVHGMRKHWHCEAGTLELHRFPDGECCPRFAQDLRGRDLVLVACLDNPDAKLFALYLCARTARELGAVSVGLVLPYLPYMRQDQPFRPGEGTNARHVGAWLSSWADWLVTVDPHLHRIGHLDEVYGIPSLVVSSAAPLADWIGEHVSQPVIVGPDQESAQWVGEVAGLLDCPMVVMRKERAGDRSVHITLDGAILPAGRTPVLLDDIAASGHTLAAALQVLHDAGASAPVCIVVHPLFAGDAVAVLRRVGTARLVSSNTILHDSNAVDICGPLARAAALLALGAHQEESE
jgi:ribose-phosphate pyrophosphokinase